MRDIGKFIGTAVRHARKPFSILFSYRSHFVFTVRRGRGPALALLALLSTALSLGPVQAAMDANECSVPPSLQGNPPIRPNVMILLDNSGSMQEEAYTGAAANVFDPTRSYYGYFDPNLCYRYGANRYDPGPASGPMYECTNATWPMSGNFMNWAFMNRFEVVKKVLVGGAWNGASGRIDGEVGERIDPNTYCIDASPWTDLDPGTGVWLYRDGNRVYLRTMSRCNAGQQGETGYSSGYCTGTHCVSTASPSTYGARFNIGYAGEQVGVVQRLAPQVRWALAQFNTSQGGRVVNYYGYSVPAMINSIRTMDATTWTPTAEALYNLIRYHRRESSAYFAGDYNATGANFDPWYQHETNPKQYVHCRKTSILVLTDGEPTQDEAIPAWLQDYDGDGNDPIPMLPPPGWPAGWPPANHPDWNEPFVWNLGNNATEHLDDVALWGNTVDHRSDLQGTQNISSHYVYAFGREPTARYVLWNAAINGGFVDKNHNGIPDTRNEWDEDGDGDPDSFHLAEDGNQLEKALTKALSTILRRTSSGTSVAVLSQSGEGEGSLVQAYYNPEMSDGSTTVTWLGFTRGLWLDRWGNLREDNSGPGTSPAESVPDFALVLTEDKIAKYRFDEVLQQTMVDLYHDADGDGVTSPADLVETKTLHGMSSLFEAGLNLYERDASSRTIYVTGPLGNRVPFTPPSATWLWTDDVDSNGKSDWLDVPLGQDSRDLIQFTRGESAAAVGQPGWRARELLYGGATVPRTWKLGSVIHSTPIFVAAPPSRFDLIYGDASYAEYFTAHTERPTVAYVGSNDGMLHAFFLGRFRNGPRADKPTADAWYEPGCVAGYNCAGVPQPGDELWAWIPRNVLPTLKFQTEQELCHVYYVDGAPQVYDARIFAPDAQHVNGWGTILVVSTRLGCQPRTIAGRRFGPTVLVLDITDPFDPQFLWEYSSVDMGYATSQPIIARIAGDWFLLFGSGPQDYAFRTGFNPPSFFAVNMSKGFAVSRLPLPSSGYQEWLHRPVAVDLNIDYDVDVVYLSTAIPKSTHNHGGRILRVVPRDSGGATPTTHDTGDWRIRTVFTSNAPFAGGPRFGFDGMGRAGLYIGTGRFYDTTDRSYLVQQRLIGLRETCLDDPDCTLNWDEGDLEPVAGCRLKDDGTLESGCASSGSTAAKVCEKVLDKQGWRMDYPDTGERTGGRVLLKNKTVVASAWRPTATADICERGGGIGRLWYVDQTCGITWSNDVYCSDCGPGVDPPSQPIVTTDRGEILPAENPSDFSELPGVQLFMTPYLAQ